MLKFAANLSLMFQEYEFLDRFDAAAEAGFTAVEFLFPYDHQPDVLRAKLEDNNLRLVLFNLYPGDWQQGERGLTSLKGREQEFHAAGRQALSYAEALGCRQIHAMAGLKGQGGDRATYVQNLKWLAEQAQAFGVTVLIEPINTDDMPDYFLTHTEAAAEIINEVAAPNLALQFDLYHRHKMQGGVLAAIETYRLITRHYQCAAPRDRGEPDRQGLDYLEAFKVIERTGFDGWIGCEYRPRGNTKDGLSWRETLTNSGAV